jgi:cytochrome c553
MYCRLCENLQRALAATEAEYLEASSLAYHQVSKKFAAYKNVEMERARAELQDHRMVCLAAMVTTQAIPAAILRRPHQEILRTGRVMHAA